MTYQAFPLEWPTGRPRTQDPERSRFDTTLNIARHNLSYELERIGAQNEVISTNVELRRDGFPYASRKAPDDRGVAVYFNYKGQAMCFACDRWDSVKDNVQAIRKTIEALRGVARWGSGDMMQSAFSGFTALAGPSTPNHWDILGLVRSSATKGGIQRAFKTLVKLHHPDNGGDAEKFTEITEARNAAFKEIS